MPRRPGQAAPSPLPPGWTRGDSLTCLKGTALSLEEKVWLGNLYLNHGTSVLRLAEDTGLAKATIKTHVALARKYSPESTSATVFPHHAIARGQSYIWTQDALARVTAAVNDAATTGAGPTAVSAAIRQIHAEQRASLVVPPSRVRAVKGSRPLTKTLPLSAQYIRAVKNRAAAAAKDNAALSSASTDL